MEIIIDILGILVVGSVIGIFLSPYFCLWDLEDIADSLEDIKEELEKLNERDSKGN